MSSCRAEQHFSEVVQGEEFLGLSLQQVCSLISSDKLTVSTEEKVRQQGQHTHILIKSFFSFPLLVRELCSYRISHVIMAARKTILWGQREFY